MAGRTFNIISLLRDLYSLVPAEPDGRCTVNTIMTYLLPTKLLLFRIAAPSNRFDRDLERLK
jgi:hypothetical protein